MVLQTNFFTNFYSAFSNFYSTYMSPRLGKKELYMATDKHWANMKRLGHAPVIILSNSYELNNLPYSWSRKAFLCLSQRLKESHCAKIFLW